MNEEVTQNITTIITLLSNAHGYDTLLGAMRECHMLLRKTAQLIENDEFQHSWHAKLQNISDLMPCLLCNGHYPFASEYSRGISYEPIAKQGKVFICWECCHAFKQKLDGHFNGMAYQFLFSLGKDVVELRKTYLKLEEEQQPYVLLQCLFTEGTELDSLYALLNVVYGGWQKQAETPVSITLKITPIGDKQQWSKRDQNQWNRLAFLGVIASWKIISEER